MKRTAVVVGVLAFAAGCTGSPSPRPAAHPTSSEMGKASLASAFQRTCDSSVYGTLTKNWRSTAVTAGPISWPYLRRSRDIPSDAFRAHHGRHPAMKVLALVRHGAVVEVAVPPREQRQVELLYDGSAFRDSGGYRMGDGEPAVTFHGCAQGQPAMGPGPTQFNGGFILSGARCVTLEVSWGSNSRRVRIPFGRSTCPRSSRA